MGRLDDEFPSLKRLGMGLSAVYWVSIVLFTAMILYAATVPDAVSEIPAWSVVLIVLNWAYAFGWTLDRISAIREARRERRESMSLEDAGLRMQELRRSRSATPADEQVGAGDAHFPVFDSNLDPVRAMTLIVQDINAPDDVRIRAVSALAEYREASRVHTRYLPSVITSVIGGLVVLAGAWLTTPELRGQDPSATVVATEKATSTPSTSSPSTPTTPSRE